MIKRLLLVFTCLTACWAQNASDETAPTLQVGDEVCVEGFVMDFFCVERGTLLDRSSVETLRGPELHSVHCLVDISSCVNSPFEILLDPIEGAELHSRGWRLEEASKAQVVNLARSVGTSCSTCTGMGSQREGFRIAANATVLDLGSSTIPPTISIQEFVHTTAMESVCGDRLTAPPIGNITTSRSNLNMKFKAHGSLMMLGWGFLIPAGTISARFFKHRPGSIWFKLHIMLQVPGLFFALIGFIIALKNFDVLDPSNKGHDSYKHAIMGCTTMAIGLAQPLNAMIRPHPAKDGEAKSTLRLAWEIWHKFSGYAALAIGFTTIVYGTRLLSTIEEQERFQMAFGIGVAVLSVVLIGGMTVDKVVYSRSKSHEHAEETKPMNEEAAVP